MIDSNVKLLVLILDKQDVADRSEKQFLLLPVLISAP